MKRSKSIGSSSSSSSSGRSSTPHQTPKRSRSNQHSPASAPPATSSSSLTPTPTTPSSASTSSPSIMGFLVKKTSADLFAQDSLQRQSSPSSSSSSSSSLNLAKSPKSLVPCPCCGFLVSESSINSHLDSECFVAADPSFQTVFSHENLPISPPRCPAALGPKLAAEHVEVLAILGEFLLLALSEEKKPQREMEPRSDRKSGAIVAPLLTLVNQRTLGESSLGDELVEVKQTLRMEEEEAGGGNEKMEAEEEASGGYGSEDEDGAGGKAGEDPGAWVRPKRKLLIVPEVEGEGGDEENEEETGPVHRETPAVRAGPDGDDDLEEVPQNTAVLTYYERSFFLIFDTFLSENSHLLNEEDRQWVETFNSLSVDARRLYIRLFQRKTKWVRVSRLKYQDIGNVPEAIALLERHNFFVGKSVIGDAEVALQLLTCQELREIMRTLKVSPPANPGNQPQQPQATNKDSLVAAIMEHTKSQKRLFGSSFSFLFQQIFSFTGEVVSLARPFLELCKRMNLAFFMNSSHDEQTMATLLIVDFFNVKYPQYKIHKTRPAFPDRDALISYDKALRVEKFYLDLLETRPQLEDKGSLDCLLFDLLKRAVLIWKSLIRGANLWPQDLNAHVPREYFLTRFNAGWVYTRMVSAGIEVLDRKKAYIESSLLLRQLLDQKVYCLGDRGAWWDRLALVLDSHLKKKELSARVCEEGLKDSFLRTGHRHSLSKRLVRLGKRNSLLVRDIVVEYSYKPPQKIFIKGVMEQNKLPGVKSEFIGSDGKLCSVERLTIQYYRTLGWKAMHSENGIFSTLFGIIFWDILFCDQPDVFQSKYQSAPLDLECEAFYYVRKTEIEARLAKLTNGEFPGLILRNYDSNRGRRCVGVNWKRYSGKFLVEIAAALGGPKLAALCRYLAEDYRHRSSGLPDLFVWKTDPLMCKLVEVKGPNDRLSDKQIVWLDAFQDCSIEAEVCHVQEAKPYEEPTVPIAPKTAPGEDSNEGPSSQISVQATDSEASGEEGPEKDPQIGWTAFGAFTTTVVGHKFVCQNQGGGFSRKRLGLCCKTLRDGRSIFLERDAANPNDPNAVQICLKKSRKALGYVPRAQAPSVAKLLDLGVALQGTLNFGGPKENEPLTPLPLAQLKISYDPACFADLSVPLRLLTSDLPVILGDAD